MQVPLLKLDNITKRYANRTIFSKISLEILPGEVFGIIGPSGVGKTTFLNTIAGFLVPDEGDVLLGKNEPVSIFKRPDIVKKTFGYGAQQPSFYSQLTVYENMDYFATLYGLSNDVKKKNIDTLLFIMELDSFRKTLAQNLSGGMQRRLDIACSLVHGPEVLILDEPTADLDPLLSKQIWTLIKKINKKGTTIIVATHHIADLEAVCSRIGILMGGGLSYVGTVAELLNNASKCQEIHIETYPGDYEKLLECIHDDSIIKKENRGYEMVLHTAKPESVLHKLLHEINSRNETMIDIRITKLSLDEVFLTLARKNRKK